MFHIQFTGEIVGGPMDGTKVLYEGESEIPLAEIAETIDTLELEGHRYKIIEIDMATRHTILMW